MEDRFPPRRCHLASALALALSKEQTLAAPVAHVVAKLAGGDWEFQ
jgi:hypothetical protein